jgi:hypothetical protein
MMGRKCSTCGRDQKWMKILAKKKIEPEKKRPTGKLRLEDNFKMDLNKEGGRVWIGFKWLVIGTSGRIFCIQ